jgi:hypothetical protein
MKIRWPMGIVNIENFGKKCKERKKAAMQSLFVDRA